MRSSAGVVAAPVFEERPETRSYDSGEECSLDHWLEVYRLVEEASDSETEPEWSLAS